MKNKAPATRRQFSGPWDEIEYLYYKLLYWFYDREELRKARPFADRLERLLQKVGTTDESIFAEACRSLLAEFRGDLTGAIRHRLKEIDLIRNLQELSRNHPGESYVARRYDASDLSDRLDLLAALYHDAGKLDQAFQTLNESKHLCERHAIPFDGQDLLDEYLAENQERKDRRRA